MTYQGQEITMELIAELEFQEAHGINKYATEHLDNIYKILEGEMAGS